MAYDLLLSPHHIRNFWAKVQKGVGPHDCWAWTGWKNQSGHARFEVAGQKVLATHVALILFGRPRPAPPSDCALHSDHCVTPSCVNPDHLRWGSQKENADDRDRLRRRTPLKGEQHGNAKLTDEQVRYIRAAKKSQYVIAREVGVTQARVSAIRRGAAWQHVK